MRPSKRASTYTLYECELRWHVLPFFAAAPLVGYVVGTCRTG
jgi:hypothetical protein